jgi:hypothetical protein
MSMGALSGFCVGIMLEKKYINFSPAGSLMEGILRYIFGAAVLMLLYSSEKFLFSKNVPYYMAYVFAHSWILSIWVAAGAPWLFKKYRI